MGKFSLSSFRELLIWCMLMFIWMESFLNDRFCNGHAIDFEVEHFDLVILDTIWIFALFFHYIMGLTLTDGKLHNLCYGGSSNYFIISSSSFPLVFSLMYLLFILSLCISWIWILLLWVEGSLFMLLLIICIFMLVCSVFYILCWLSVLNIPGIFSDLLRS